MKKKIRQFMFGVKGYIENTKKQKMPMNEMFDYLKSNCRSWEYNCDNYEDTLSLANKLQMKFPRIEFEKIFDIAKNWTNYEDDKNEDTQTFPIKNSNNDILSDAITIMENLLAYGRIHTIRGVKYTEGSHEDILNRAEKWLNDIRNKLMNNDYGSTGQRNL